MAAPTPTITLEQARAMADDYTRGALAVLPPGTQPEPSDRSETLCQDVNDGQPEGRVQVNRAYQLRNLSTTQNPATVEAVHRYFLARGFRVVQDRRPVDLSVYYNHPVDGFNASIVSSVEGTLDLGAASPCIWPDGRGPAAG